MFKIAVVAATQAFLEEILKQLPSDQFEIVTSGLNHRQAIRDARDRDNKADLIIFDLEGAPDEDILFLLGAQAFHEFRVLLLTKGDQPLPIGFDVGMTRADVEADLYEKVKAIQKLATRTPPRYRR